MKRLTLISAALLLMVQAFAQNIVFERTHHDFGTHKEDGGSIAHDYVFTNVGQTAVAVAKVESGCRCTRAEYSRDEVAPGRKGKVRVIYEPWDFPGEAEKGVKVTFTDGTSQGLNFHVNIIPRIKPVAEECLVVLADNVRLDKTDVDMRQVKIGESKEGVIKWGHIGSSRHSFALRPAGKVSGLLKIDAPSTVRPSERGEIRLTYDVKKYGGSPRFVRDRYDVLVDGKTVSTISTFAAITPSAGHKGHAGKLQLNCQYHNFGTVARGREPQKPLTLILTNAGDGVLKIHDADIPAGFSLDRELPASLAPDEKVSVKVNMDSKAMQTDNVFCNLSLLTSDPDYPVKEIILSARIR